MVVNVASSGVSDEETIFMDNRLFIFGGFVIVYRRQLQESSEGG